MIAWVTVATWANTAVPQAFRAGASCQWLGPATSHILTLQLFTRISVYPFLITFSPPKDSKMALRFGRTHTYVSDSKANDETRHCIKNVFLCGLTLGSVGLLWTFEKSKAAFALSASEIKESVVEYTSSSIINPGLSGRLVHITSSDIAPGRELADPSFGLSFPKAWSVQRNTEYCQWLEISNSHVVKHDDGTETVRLMAI